MAIRKLVKGLIPQFILRLYHRRGLRSVRAYFASKSTQEAFDEIYRKKFWGDVDGQPYSGSGSRGEVAVRYSEAVAALINEHSIDSVLDIGCGDFYIGRAILDRVNRPVTYVGIDASQYVTRFNQEHFSGPNISFICLDASKDELPRAQLCLIRQVLQHLSNQQIASVLDKLSAYTWVLITEHYPDDDHLVAANLDKPHGPDTRLYDLSAVYIDRPPFCLKGAINMLEIRAEDVRPGIASYIRTWLIKPGSTGAI
jgi:SAM-dependent methyltransferase